MPGRTEAASAERWTLDMSRIEVIAPNFKRRLSGVTSTIVQLVPVQARTLGIATLGPGLPDALPTIGVAAACRRCWRRPASGRKRIWHARRNVEMIGGMLLTRRVAARRCNLVFTSAAQRDHRPFTKWLIRRMDAVIATSARSGGFLEVPHTWSCTGSTSRSSIRRAGAEDAFAASGLPGKIRDRLLRPGPASEGHRPFRRRHDCAAAGFPGLDSGDHRPGHGRASRFCATG